MEIGHSFKGCPPRVKIPLHLKEKEEKKSLEIYWVSFLVLKKIDEKSILTKGL